MPRTQPNLKVLRIARNPLLNRPLSFMAVAVRLHKFVKLKRLALEGLQRGSSSLLAPDPPPFKLDLLKIDGFGNDETDAAASLDWFLRNSRATLHDLWYRSRPGVQKSDDGKGFMDVSTGILQLIILSHFPHLSEVHLVIGEGNVPRDLELLMAVARLPGMHKFSMKCLFVPLKGKAVPRRSMLDTAVTEVESQLARKFVTVMG